MATKSSNRLPFVQRIVFHSGQRLAGSAYGAPIYNQISLPTWFNDADFVAVKVVDAYINCDFSGTYDDSVLELNLVNMLPMNQNEASGTGTKSSPHLAHVPFALKQSGGSKEYKLTYRDVGDQYLLYPFEAIQNGNLNFEIKDGTGTVFAGEPSTGSALGYTFVLSFEPLTQEMVTRMRPPNV